MGGVSCKRSPAAPWRRQSAAETAGTGGGGGGGERQETGKERDERTDGPGTLPAAWDWWESVRTSEAAAAERTLWQWRLWFVRSVSVCEGLYCKLIYQTFRG
jgi:hypothetical protein